jgi:hypothetical protein
MEITQNDVDVVNFFSPIFFLLLTNLVNTVIEMFGE